ncbi:MAG TPA: PP2C family serine/threonine-protein phosphatase [Polyangiaceae bacterium]|jgi:serine/threonine protein phosphatase PrpC
MRRCPACHALYPDDDRFCEVDGEVLANEPDPVLSSAPTLPIAPPPEEIPIIEGARTLLGEGPRVSPERIEQLVRETIDFGRHFERANLAWQPQPEDFVFAVDGSLALASARGVFRRTGAFDVRPALRALGEALLDAPAAICSTAVVRLLSDPRLPTLSPDEALALLDGGEALAPEAMPGAAILAHIGYRRADQQDAVREVSADGWTVLVLCDGVSGSSDGGLAARVGSAAACDRAAELMRAGESVDHVVRDAILAGHRAVCTASMPVRHSSRPPGPLAADRTTESRVSTAPPPSIEPPGATIIVAAIRGARAGIGWAGDSRAYMLGQKAELLTQDHSWANAMLATGHVTEEEAFAQPLAYALTRCIGPLDESVGDLVPEVRVVDVPAGATLVLCSDGVWSYLARAEMMNAALKNVSVRDAGVIARALVHEALLRGGHDNASVAIYVAPA